MIKNENEKSSSRRGFLTSFLKELNRSGLGQLSIPPEQVSRASILALQFAKNDADLIRVAVKSPVHIEDSLFNVTVTGQDISGHDCCLNLRVDCVVGRVHEIDSEL